MGFSGTRPRAVLSWLAALALSSFLGLSAFAQAKAPSLCMPPPYSQSNADGFWQLADVDPGELRVDALRQHLQLCVDTGADSQLVVYKGRIISEWYSRDYREPLGAMSSTKVVASILVGQLVDQGRLSCSTRVKDILPEWSGGLRDQVTIEQLLTHTAGFRRRVAKGESIGFAEDKRAFVLGLYPDAEPGSKYEYSNEGIQLLEPVLARLTGRDTAGYAQEVLFQRLGMGDTELYAYGGSAWLYAELRTTPRDMARLGLLMLGQGLWKGQRILSPDYISRATSPSKANGEMGYAWWLFGPSTRLRGYYASGYLNNDIYVFPDYDLVIVRTQAPDSGYSGKPESGDYFKKAIPLFRRMRK